MRRAIRAVNNIHPSIVESAVAQRAGRLTALASCRILNLGWKRFHPGRAAGCRPVLKKVLRCAPPEPRHGVRSAGGVRIGGKPRTVRRAARIDRGPERWDPPEFKQ
jgi:hypothetical protein